MTESEYLERVYLALKKVPKKNLLIIELANRYLKDGVLDFTGLAEAQPEVNMAIAEAKMYGAYTMVAVDTLKRVKAMAEDA
ncbi:unnamed protein product [marine sediment metagenome]|uniref:Uncharacterized protein n=1 Tax=marine sediment metagenome TaxID=412755 RepID=X1HYF7_9ZZZZ